MSLRWQRGRQDTGYEKLRLLFLGFFDVYLLRYPEGSYVPEHQDHVRYPHRHYRFNFVLRRAKEGGEFVCGKTIFRWWRAVFFRADKYPHWVTPIVRGTRWVLSIGFVR